MCRIILIDLKSGRLESGQVVFEKLLILLSDSEEAIWLTGHLLVGAEVHGELTFQLYKRVNTPWLKAGALYSD